MAQYQRFGLIKSAPAYDRLAKSLILTDLYTEVAEEYRVPVPKDDMKKKARALKRAAGAAPLIVSAASGEGVREVLRALAAEVGAVRAKGAKEKRGQASSSRGWRP